MHPETLGSAPLATHLFARTRAPSTLFGSPHRAASAPVAGKAVSAGLSDRVRFSGDFPPPER